jgi:tetratricopeptide (TPR) repeat protein
LKVDWILEGSVQVDKNRLRVLANLLRATDGTTVWTERYDRDAVDIFTLEDEIALSVVKALQVKPPPKAGVQFIDRGTESPEAHKLFLRAQHYSTKGFVFYERAIECFEQAIEKDPNFARAYSGLAGCTFGLGCNGLTEPEKAYPKAKTAALKALDIDPNDSRALIILASIKMVYEWDFSGAEQDIREALRKDPAAPRLHLMYADLLSALGRHEEALEEAKQASDSALPHPSTVNGQAMFTLYRTRRYDLAVEMLKKNLEFDPFYAATYGNLTAVYLAMGRYQDARETHDRSHEIMGVIEKQDKDDPTSAIIYAGMGQTAEARRILAGIKAKMKTSYVMPIEVAAVHAALGDREEAFAWLEKAYQERCAYLYGIKCDAWFDSLRDDPRFTDLLRRIGLEK